MSKFKIQGVGIDCSTIEFSPLEDLDFEYLFTSIEANNESVIEEFIKTNSGSPLITRIDFLDKSSLAIKNHLYGIDRDYIDLLLVNANCDFVKYADDLSYLVDYKFVDVIGVYNPESVDRLKEIMSVIPNLKYVGLEICPLNFNLELMQFIKENELEVIAFNPFGGKISSWGVISSLTVPFLLEFMASYATLGILSGRDVYLSWKEKDYLEDLIDQENTREGNYSLDKSVSGLYKPLQKVVGMSLKMDINHTLPIDKPDSLFAPDELEITLGEAVKDCRDFDVEVESLEDDVYNLYKDFKTPDDTDSDSAIISLFKPIVQETMFNLFGHDWIISEQKIDDKIFILSATHPIFRGWGWFRRLKKVEVKNYLFSINNKSLEFTKIAENENIQFANLEGLDS